MWKEEKQKEFKELGSKGKKAMKDKLKKENTETKKEPFKRTSPKIGRNQKVGVVLPSGNIKLIKFKKVVTWLSQLQTGKLDNVKLVYTTGGIPNDVHEGGKDTYLYVAVNIKDANLKLDKLDLNNVHSVIEFCDKHKLKRYAGIKMDSDKTYETSSKNKEFRKDWRDDKWLWIVCDWASYKEMQQIENELLIANGIGKVKNDLWYNLKPGFPGVPRVRWSLLSEISKELLWLKNYDLTDNNGIERNFVHCDPKWLTDSPETPVTELYKMIQSREYIQPRIETIDRDHLDGIKGDIKMATGSTDDADPVMIFVNRWYKGKFYKRIIFDGNHTITAYHELENYRNITNLKTILVPESLHKHLSDKECKELGNDMNSLVQRKKPFTLECAKRDLLVMAREGLAWRTAEVLTTFTKRGLRETSVTTAWDYVEQKLIDDSKEAIDINVMDYDGVHKPVVDELMEIQMKSGLYLALTYSASGFIPMRAQKHFHAINEERILNGKVPYRGMIINLKFVSEKVRDKAWPKLLADIEILKTKEYKTEMHFNPLEMYVDGDINVDSICKPKNI